MNLEENQVSGQWPQFVTICEVGPRDGLQNEKTRLDVEQKLELIERSTAAGARIIEIGSFVHPKAVPQMADTDEVARRLIRQPDVEYRALVLNLKGMERAEAAGVTKVKLTASASRAHSLANSNRTPEEVVHSFDACAEYAATHNLKLSGAISTTFGCSLEGKVPFEQVLSVIECFREIGVNELSLSDTTGMANPRQVYSYGQYVREKYPEVSWVMHFHDTRGMGLSNVMAGMLAGITCFDACFAGLGGCPFAPGASGNIATEDLLHMCGEMAIATGYDLDLVIDIGRRVQEMIGHSTASSILRAGKSSDIVKSSK